jgi:hypothetical protein
MRKKINIGRKKRSMTGRKSQAQMSVAWFLTKRRPILAGCSGWPGLTHIIPYRAFGDIEAELEQFALDTLRAPEQVLAGQLLDQVNGLERELGLRTLGPGFAFPEQTQAYAMPAQEVFGLDNQEGVFPVGDTAGEQQQPEAVAAIQVRAFDLTGKDDELLAQQGIRSDQFCLAASEVSEAVKDDGRVGGCGPAAEAAVKKRKEATER